MVSSTVPKLIRLSKHGQITIPKEIREVMKLDNASRLSVFVAGRYIVLTPKRLLRASLIKDFEKAMKDKNLSPEDVLSDLQAERKRYNKEAYHG